MRPLQQEDISPLGSDLHRPECVMGSEKGDVYVPDWEGGVTAIRADGSQQRWLASSRAIDLKPNGVAFTPAGNFLIANLSEDGGVWEMDRHGRLAPFLAELSGYPLPPANFVYVDDDERTWISVSTRHRPRQLAWRDDVADGFIVLVDHRGSRIVADNLQYTNEVRVDPTGRWLYAVETFGRRLVRFPLRADGLESKQLVLQLEDGFFPDGFAFDVEGGLWLTSLVSNKVIRVHSEGTFETVIADTNDARVAEVDAAFANRQMVTAHLGPIADTRFQHITSIAFGGSDHRTAWLGCLHNDTIFTFRSDVAGAPLPHWRYDLP